MSVKRLEIDKLVTDRLILIPFTTQICKNVLDNDFSDLITLNLKKGKSWPDADVLDTLPRVINNLNKVGYPTGYESWMIIKKDTLEIIGDVGFKGINMDEENIDLGYGIIEEERRKGYAAEAVKEIISWAFLNNNIREITANCLTENTNSMKLLLKFNFTQKRIAGNTIYWKLLNQNYINKTNNH
ncbi:MAG: GNAT family N-acetyltransferase [Chitinophagaceae bacterium]|nr:GNAT family N-acetyltransferase [Chitinophagaceae bacterium]